MEFHPVTFVLGIIGAIALLILTITGLACTVYVLDPDSYLNLKFLYQLAKLKRVC